MKYLIYKNTNKKKYMNSTNFKLIEIIEKEGDYNLNDILNKDINLRYFDDLLNFNINQINIYEILWIADYYQYKKMEELIEKIQILILDGKIKIEYDKLNKEDLYNSIYINECLKSGKIKCDLKYKIHDVCCVKYLESKGYKGDERVINWAAENGQIETIKYLESKGYKGDENAINNAALNGHIETIKYLESKRYRGTWMAINYAAENGHIETIKYLESKRI